MLKKLSLLKQLLLILGIIALGFTFILMPIIDYNLNSIVDNQVYDDVLNIDISVKKKIKFLRMNDYDYTKKINEKFL